MENDDPRDGGNPGHAHAGHPHPGHHAGHPHPGHHAGHPHPGHAAVNVDGLDVEGVDVEPAGGGAARAEGSVWDAERDSVITKRDIGFTRIAVKNGFMSEEQVRDCFDYLRSAREYSDDHLTIENVVVQRGYLNNEQATAVSVAYERLRKDAERRLWSIPGYEIYSKIGEGGLGVVFKAKQLSMNRIVALKVLHRRWLNDEEFKKRFLIEARLVGKLSHQNLIKVFDVGREDWKYYYSMEFVDGETVEEVLERDGKLITMQAINITLQMTRALRYLHGFNIVHCDIKPGNILMTSTGQAKLGDFGFVKSNIDIKVTDEGSVLGTPDYISPEQAMGKDVDFRSDIYSLGATFYHMLTGRPPYEGSVSSKMKKHIKGNTPSPQMFNPSVSDLVADVVLRMMSRDPVQRYPNFEDLFKDLERIRDAEAGRSDLGDPGAGDAPPDPAAADLAQFWRSLAIAAGATALVSLVVNLWLILAGNRS